MTRRVRQIYTPEFKRQMVDLYQAEKPRAQIIKEYDFMSSAFDRWCRQAKQTDSFETKDKLTTD